MFERIDRIADLARELNPVMVELRRAVHAHPESGWNEHATTSRIRETLRSFGLEPRVRPEGTGAVVEVGTGDTTVGFRADLDALPIDEKASPPYRSTVPGVMHACGHDVHTAIGVGIACILSKIPDIGGRARILFQPAEELLPGGALTLRDEGVHHGLEALIAFHVDPAMAAGTIGARVGAITSASDRMSITLGGPGGHTSRPHQTVDLINVAAKIITELPQMLRSNVDPREPLAVVFGRVAGGSADNVIPTAVELGGTLRVFDRNLWRELPGLVESSVAALAGPLGAEFEIAYVRGSPPVVNDAEVAEVFASAARACLGVDQVVHTHQSLGSEDLAWFLEDVPGAMFRLGAGLEEAPVDLHSATFDVDERCIEAGMRVGATALVGLLEHYGS